MSKITTVKYCDRLSQNTPNITQFNVSLGVQDEGLAHIFVLSGIYGI